MKKKLIGIFILLAALILPLTNADAATYRWKRMPLNSFIGVYPSGMTIGSYPLKIGIKNGYRYIEAHVVEDGSSIYHGYCLHIGKEIYSDSNLGLHSGFDDLRGSDGNPVDETRQNVLKNILASGYQNGDRTIDNFVSGDYVHRNNTVGACVNTEICAKVLATQLLVWEVQTGARADYGRDPKGNDAYKRFVNENTALRSAYNSILDGAEDLTRKENFPASGQTYVLRWNDPIGRYMSSSINVGRYNVDKNVNGLSIENDSDSTVKVYSDNEINNPIQINAKLVKGSTLASSTAFRWYRFIDHSDAQDVLMGDYSVTLSDSFNVKTEKGKFFASKIDADTKTLLKGSKFNLYKCYGSNCSNRKLLQEIDLTENPQDVEVTITKSGAYYFEETVVPYGYNRIGDFIVDFVIDSESGLAKVNNISTNLANKQKMDDGSIKDYSLVIENEEKEFVINKVDGSTNNPVNGATFQIKDSKGNLVKFELVNGVYRYSPSGTITDLVDPSKSQYSIALLPEGEYTIVETNVPYPYVLAGSKDDRERKIKINADSDLEIWNYKTKVYNKSTNASITIKNFKTLLVIKKTGTGGTPLSNVKFEIYDGNKSKQIILAKNVTTNEYEYVQGQTGSPIQIETTGNGTAVIRYLPAGKYWIKETVTVDGYVIDETNEWTQVEIKVNKDSAPRVNKTITNAKEEFTFYKIDEDGNYISDGKFKIQIYNEETSKYEDVPLLYNEETKTYKIDYTNESDIYIFTPVDGMATFTDVKAKTKYRVVEIEAPEGFVLPKASEARVDLVINENGYAIGDTMLINKKITVEEGATAQAELIINISTGQNRIRYVLIIGGLIIVIAGLFIINRKLKK